MWSWRHCWKYLPVFRFYIYSGVIVFAIFKFVVPIKPRHRIMYHKGKADAHHHEVEHWYGIRQKKADAGVFQEVQSTQEGRRGRSWRSLENDLVLEVNSKCYVN
ncbi:hypothetical protein OSTOST_13544, partial [Ostertagia ostertagi]